MCKKFLHLNPQLTSGLRSFGLTSPLTGNSTHNTMKSKRFIIQLKDIKQRHHFAPSQKLIDSKKRYKRKAKHRHQDQ